MDGTALGKPQAVISEEALAIKNANLTGEVLYTSGRRNSKSRKLSTRSLSSKVEGMDVSILESARNHATASLLILRTHSYSDKFFFLTSALLWVRFVHYVKQYESFKDNVFHKFQQYCRGIVVF